MGRTKESYLVGAGITEEEARPLDFSDEAAWPTPNLVDSVAHDYGQLELVKGYPDRAAAIGRSIAQKEFELGQRLRDQIAAGVELLPGEG